MSDYAQSSTVTPDFDHAVQALMVCANLSRQESLEAMTRHAEQCPFSSPLVEALRNAHQEALEKTTAFRAAAAAAKTAGTADLRNYLQPASNELSASRAEFISAYLGEGSRAMTAVEISTANKNSRREAFTGEPSAIVPRNLEKYWAHHQRITQLTPRGATPIPKYQARIHRMSCDALHEEACSAACKRKLSPAQASAGQAEARDQAACDEMNVVEKFTTKLDHS